ncbi:MAG TPA: MFS transporter [Candidatus Limnocylindrales bacterium]|nr:MFS transporter [Candidatus Limnocylindrales bacterium]
MNATPLRHRNFALLWSAGLISLSGNWMLRIALPIFVLQLTGSVVAISGVVIATVVPILLFGLVAGVFVDRWDRRWVMVGANLLQGVLLLPLIAVGSVDRVWIVYVVAFLQSTLSQFFEPAETALLPKVVPAEQLTAANSLNALNNNLARLAGPVLGGFGAAYLGLAGVAVIDAVTFFVAAALILLVRGSYRADRVQERAGLRLELADGFRTITHSRIVFALILCFSIGWVGEGVMATLFTPFVTGPLGGGAQELGWLMSAQAVGGITGGILGARYAGRFNPRRLVVTCMVLFGLIDVLIFNYPRVSTAIVPQLVMFALVGIPGVFGGAAVTTIVQTEVPDARIGRVFSVVFVAGAIAQLIGTGIASALVESLGVMTVLTLQGLGYVVGGILFAAISTSYRATVPSRSAPELGRQSVADQAR